MNYNGITYQYRITTNYHSKHDRGLLYPLYYFFHNFNLDSPEAVQKVHFIIQCLR